jgi:hypothetical protein
MNLFKRLLGCKTDVEILTEIRNNIASGRAETLSGAFELCDWSRLNIYRVNLLSGWSVAHIEPYGSIRRMFIKLTGIDNPSDAQLKLYRVRWLNHLINYCEKEVSK